MGIRTSFVCCVAALVVACGASPGTRPTAPPAPAPDDVARYLPLEDDTVLAFETSVESTGEKGVLMLQIRRPFGQIVELDVGGHVKRVEVVPHAIRNLDGGYLLKAPLTTGATWQGMAGTVRVVDADKSVVVPAGHFEHCVETVEEAVVANGRKTITTDFCPGVGIVVLDVEATIGTEYDKETAHLRSRGKRIDLSQGVPR